MERFEIAWMLQSAFGYISLPPYARLNQREQIVKALEYCDLKVSQYKTNGVGEFGMPLIMPCKLNDFQLPLEQLIEITRSKVLVKTPIDGQKGTFKELYAQDDTKIVIRGIVVQDDGTDNYPDTWVRRIKEICDEEDAVPVVNELISTIFGIQKVVIENVSFPAPEGAQNWQPYIINCLSDFDYDIELKP